MPTKRKAAKPKVKPVMAWGLVNRAGVLAACGFPNRKTAAAWSEAGEKIVRVRVEVVR